MSRECVRGCGPAVYHFTAYCNHRLHPIEHDYCSLCMTMIEAGEFTCSGCNKERTGKGPKPRFTILTKETIEEKEEADDESVHEGA